MIEDQVLPSVLVRKGFAQLLRYPGAGRMLGDADMQDAPAIMANHEESIQQPEGNGGHGEEIHRSNGLPVILEKCLPASDGIRIAWRSLDSARDCPLRNIESELEQFAMNTRSAPGWILRGHLKDQISKFLVDSLPAWRWTSLRQELPIQTKSSAVPADDGGRRDNQQRILPFCPEPFDRNPKQSAECSKFWTIISSLEDYGLLTKDQIFE